MIGSKSKNAARSEKFPPWRLMMWQTTMYGTIARFRLKPGMENALMEQLRAFEGLKVPGFIMTYLYRMDSDPQEYYMVVLFQDRATYISNAESPGQDAYYRKMRALMESDPEWHDGEVVIRIASTSGLRH
jgi:quinol monooxygenase YgiN